MKQYHKTNITKSINQVGKEYNRSRIKNIAGLELIGIEHLISVCLYTDYDRLSADFSSTFRKILPFESIDQIKQRNKKYWWWSKLLAETVIGFGDNG